MGKYYVVTVGRHPGVYSSWIEAAANIRNIPGGAIYQSFPSKEEAIRAFNAATQRGEVRAYPNVKSDLDEAFGNAPLFGGSEAALLRTPVRDVKLEVDIKPSGPPTPLHARVAELRRTLRHPPDSSPTSSSPATEFTQVNPSLYVDDDDDDSPVPCSTPVVRRSPHLTFDSGSSRAHPSISGARTQFQLDVSAGSSLLATPEHTFSVRPEWSKGVKYRSLSDLEGMKNVDARIWAPKSPIFNPAKVKRWPKSRSPSPTKKDTVALPKDEAVGDDDIVLADASFIRAGRGRYSRLTPSSSLPILPDRGLENNYCAIAGSRPTQARESPCTVNVRAKEVGCSLSDKHLAGSKIYAESHVQTVPREGGDGQSSIMVHCSASCAHARFVKGITPDLDARSPISKGTLVPLDAAETLFGRPSPQFHRCNA